MKQLFKLITTLHDIRLISSFFLLDIFFPKFCVGCGEYGNYVCEKCVKEIEIIKTSTCPECGKISPLGKFCSKCKQKLNIELSGIIVAANYEVGPTREMIHHLKYSGFTELSDLLGELIVQRMLFEPSLRGVIDEAIYLNGLPRPKDRSRNDRKDTILIPVPLHVNKQTKRGFNQSELIAQYVSNRTKIPFKNALARVKQTESQVGLTGSERRSNLEGAFVVNKKSLVSGKSIFLVDDVTTTYSTLNECAKELKSAGAKKVYGLVVAKG